MHLLDSILLIDDDTSTNFLNRYIIDKGNYTKKCHCVDSAEEAISFLKYYKKEIGKLPDLILLDLNMPGLDGWDFLDLFKELDLENNTTNIYILTTSTREADKVKLKKYNFVNGFHAKPLNGHKIETILDEISV